MQMPVCFVILSMTMPPLFQHHKSPEIAAFPPAGPVAEQERGIAAGTHIRDFDILVGHARVPKHPEICVP